MQDADAASKTLCSVRQHWIYQRKKIPGMGVAKTVRIEYEYIEEIYCFTVHFDSLNLMYQLIHLYTQQYYSKMLILKHLKTLQHVSIIIQIIISEFVGSLLKSLNLKFNCQRLDVVMWQHNVILV